MIEIQNENHYLITLYPYNYRSIDNYIVLYPKNSTSPTRYPIFTKLILSDLGLVWWVVLNLKS